MRPGLWKRHGRHGAIAFGNRLAQSATTRVAVKPVAASKVGFPRAPKEGSSTWFCGFVNLKDGPGSEDKLYDFINAWLAPEAARGLLDTIGYGHTNLKGMETIADDPAVTEGLGAIEAPILAQTPNDPAQREKQLAEFEKVKAGF